MKPVNVRDLERTPRRRKQLQDFSVSIRASLRDEDLLAARSRLSQLEEDARARGFEVQVGAVGFVGEEAA